MNHLENHPEEFRNEHAARRFRHRAPSAFFVWLSVVCAVCAVCALCGACVAPRPTAPPVESAAAPALDAPMARRLDQVVQQALHRTGVPGVIVGVWSPRGSYVRTFGVADTSTGAPMRPDLFMRIGSETKTFTVTALLQLVDQRRVALDDPISKYLPGVPDGDRITLRELARMQSGLFNYSDDDRFARRLFADPLRPYTPAQLLALSFSHPPAFPPGRGWQYSNTNAVLLGLVVERVSGRPLSDYLREHVFAPLGLRGTSLPSTNAYPQPHPQGYTQTPEGQAVVATDWNPSWGWAAGSAISDLADLHTWAPALATGRLLTPLTQAQRLQTVSPPGFRSDAGYGLGLFRVAGWIGHNGSMPGYQALAVHLPSAKTTMVVLLNTDDPADGEEPSSVFAAAITRIITPRHVFLLRPAPPAGTAPPAEPTR